MAERRMFAKTIVLSDAFLDMPLSARALYMTLGMVADDDGFVNNPKSIMRQCGASVDDINILLAKRFILAFDSGVIVIKHWRINNYLRSDRYQETKYIDEKSQLVVEENGAYTVGIPGGIPTGIPSSGTPSIGKDRIGKDSVDIESKSAKRFVPPTLEDVSAYCKERNNHINPAKFIAFYESKGWMVGKNKMKDWKAAIRNWEQRDSTPTPEAQSENMSSLFQSVLGGRA